jgi:hypothetical protein
MGKVMDTNVSISVAKSREARERICERFNMDAKPAEWEGLYSDVLSRNG